MKRVIAILGLATFGPALPTQAEVVEIPDPELQEAIRAQLDRPTGDITRADMESLTELDSSVDVIVDAAGLARMRIQSLEGLQAATNLQSLDLSGRPFLHTSYRRLSADVDFSPLAALTNLAELNLSHNKLTSLTLPAALTSLTTLVLGYNRLSDFSFLRGLTGLTRLDLDNNQLTSLTLPAGLNSLFTLMLDDNPLTNLTLPESLRARIDDATLQVSGFSVREIIYYDDSPIRITGIVLRGTNLTIRFTATSGVTDWKVWGSGDLARFPDDKTADSAISESSPGSGTYEALVDVSGEPSHYFLRIER